MTLAPAIAVTLLAACSRIPTDALSYRESWEILGHTDQGRIIDATAVFANTDLLRGQGWLAVDQWAEGETPISMGRSALPGEVRVGLERDRVDVGPDHLGLSDDGSGAARWTARFGSLEANAVVHVDSGGPSAAPVAWQSGGGQWTLTAPVTDGRLQGWIEADKRGGMLRGSAVVLHHGGDGWPGGPREAAFVLGAGVAIGIDRHGSRHIAWAEVDGAGLDASNAALAREDDGRWTLDFRPGADLVVHIKERGARGSRDPLPRLFRAEKALLDRVSAVPRRTVSAAQARIEHGGHDLRAPAIVLVVAPP